MLTQASIDAFISHLRRQGASENTTRAYRSDLEQILVLAAANTTWQECEDVLADVLTAKRKEWAPRTTQRKLTSLRSWGKYAGNPLLLNAYRAPVAAPPEPHPIPEGIAGVLRMIRSTRNPRHRALCTLTGLMGLRVGEAVAIRPEHVNATTRELKVQGKGDRGRIVPISDTAYGFLLPAIDLAIKNNTTLVDRTNRGARAAITRHAKNAGLSARVSTHDMRATLATAAYEMTHDLRAVQELLGHADSKTTQTYTLSSMTARRAAIEVA